MILQFKCKNAKQERRSENMEEKMEVHIEVFVNTYDDIKDIVKLGSDIQKEHSCHCTLFVKQSH